MREFTSADQSHDHRNQILLRTRIFNLSSGRYRSLSELAQVMGIPVSQIYRLHQGKSSINRKFIIKAIEAFLEREIGEIFYFTA